MTEAISPSHNDVLHGILWIVGMVLHGVVRWVEWKKADPKKNQDYMEFLFRADFMTAQVLSLLLLAFWLSDLDVGGFKFSDYVPHRPIVAMVMGYLSDSLSKHLTKAVPFLRQ